LSTTVQGGPTFHFATCESRKSEVYAFPLSSNWVWSGPKPVGTLASRTSAYLRTGIPPFSPSKAPASMAAIIFLNEKTLTSAWSLPLAQTYSPLGLTSTPCGLFGVGIR
jgi:hypothetical protein